MLKLSRFFSAVCFRQLWRQRRRWGWGRCVLPSRRHPSSPRRVRTSMDSGQHQDFWWFRSIKHYHWNSDHWNTHGGCMIWLYWCRLFIILVLLAFWCIWSLESLQDILRFRVKSSGRFLFLSEESDTIDGATFWHVAYTSFSFITSSMRRQHGTMLAEAIASSDSF